MNDDEDDEEEYDEEDEVGSSLILAHGDNRLIRLFQEEGLDARVNGSVESGGDAEEDGEGDGVCVPHMIILLS